MYKFWNFLERHNILTTIVCIIVGTVGSVVVLKALDFVAQILAGHA